MSTREPLGRILITPSLLQLAVCSIRATKDSGPIELTVDEVTHADQGLIEITIYSMDAS